MVERLLEILPWRDRLGVAVLLPTDAQCAVVAYQPVDKVFGPGYAREDAVGVGVDPHTRNPVLLDAVGGQQLG